MLLHVSIINNLIKMSKPHVLAQARIAVLAFVVLVHDTPTTFTGNVVGLENETHLVV